jgi:hypothetical protein
MQTRSLNAPAGQSPTKHHQAIGFNGTSRIDDADEYHAHRPVAPDFSVSMPACLDAYDGPVAFEKCEVSAMHSLKSATANACRGHSVVYGESRDIRSCTERSG